ncbi:MAG: DNA polymerase/3'-5' exonuclease PolX [Thermoanaerobaculia bacterium]|nr:DNA polymerase/3'-5' exonuclease PolX [Thermoanaerobaculia bacterium]
MDSRRAAQILRETGKLLTLSGANSFRVRAYERAAAALEGLTEDLAERVHQGPPLTELEGIGAGLAEAIVALVEQGSLDLHQELLERYPPSVLELFQVEGLGPKKLQVLVEERGIESVEALEAACRADELVDLSGFGKKTQERLLRSLAELARYRDRHLLPAARSLGEKLIGEISTWSKVIRVELAGSARRCVETVGDLDLVASMAAEDRPDVAQKLQSLDGIERVLGAGETKVSLRIEGGWQVDVRLVDEEEFASALHHFTGSKEHNIQLRGRAKERGLILNEYGLFDDREGEARHATGNRLTVADEEALYRRLDLPWIPPEMREGRGEIALAERDELPELVEVSDLRGTLHVHTDWSDGRADLETMVRTAKDLGWEYLGISDHSQAAAYAGGLTPERIREQGLAIDQLNAELEGIEILKGIECDILTDGTLDLPDDVLAELDFVVASVHSSLQMPTEQMTERLVKALQNPHVTFLGHLTGRRLLRRESYSFDWERVLRTAAQHRVIVELNAAPARLELDWRYIPAWLATGLPISIHPDAHRPAGLMDVQWGVAVARKAGVTADDVLNTRSLAGVRRWLSDRRLD